MTINFERVTSPEGQARLSVELSGWDRIWAMRKQIDVPINDVVSVGVGVRHDLVAEVAVRFRGTTIPGRVLAGSYSFWPRFRKEKGDRQIWVTYREPALLVIDTAIQKPRRIVLEVPDPRAATETVKALIGQ